jgi:hypothetical protein
MKRSLMLLSAFFILSYFAESQNEINEGLGAYGSFNLFMHETDFAQLPNVPNCCPRFLTGEGNGFSAGLYYEMPFTDKFSGQLRIGFTNIAGDLSEMENEYIIYNDELETAEIEHTLSADLGALTFGLYGRFLVFEGLALLGGVNAGLPMIKKYSQKETLVKPENYGVFENGTRTRNESEGDIDGISSIFMFAEVGISYDFELNKRRSFYLAPEVFYSFMLNDVLEEDKWQINSIRIGLTFRYSIGYELASPLKPERD